MNVISVFQLLGKNDARLVRRDTLLRLMLLLPFVYALALRWAMPPITYALAEKVNMTLYYPLIVSYLLICIPPILFGMVVGFLLLDEKDDDILSALRVTPLSMHLYLLYRLTFPIVICMTVTMLVVPLAQLTYTSPWSLAVITLLAAMEAPMCAMFMASIANNKVQGFAIMKGLGVFIALPLTAYFMPPGWQWLLGVVPNFWPMKLYWIAAENQPHFIPYALAGFVYHAGLLFVLLYLFQRRIG
jgi:fluoroquinolone transport system permease protein